MKSFVIPTSTAGHLIRKIKNNVKEFKIIFPEKNRAGKRSFPDGEIYIKIPKLNILKNKKVVILHSGTPKPNEGLIELELILQILKDNKIKTEIFFSYFPYGLQDKVFEKGETNAAENLIKKLVDYYKTRKIYIIDPHFQNRDWTKKYPIVKISAVPLLLKKARQDFGKDILFLSPDQGGKRRTGISGMKKQRLSSSEIRMLSPNIYLKGRIIGVVDDIIQKGTTLLKLYEIVKKEKAKKIIALITHGVLPEGVKKIKKTYNTLYLTNTISQKEANIDITNLIISALLNKQRF